MDCHRIRELFPTHNPNPQHAISCTISAYFGNPRDLVSCPIKRDVKRNIFPSPRKRERVGRLHPAQPLATRGFGFDRLKRAAKRRVQFQLMVPHRLSHEAVALDAIQFRPYRHSSWSSRLVDPRREHFRFGILLTLGRNQWRTSLFISMATGDSYYRSWSGAANAHVSFCCRACAFASAGSWLSGKPSCPADRLRVGRGCDHRRSGQHAWT